MIDFGADATPELVRILVALVAGAVLPPALVVLAWRIRARARLGLVIRALAVVSFAAQAVERSLRHFHAALQWDGSPWTLATSALLLAFFVLERDYLRERDH